MYKVVIQSTNPLPLPHIKSPVLSTINLQSTQPSNSNWDIQQVNIEGNIHLLRTLNVSDNSNNNNSLTSSASLTSGNSNTNITNTTVVQNIVNNTNNNILKSCSLLILQPDKSIITMLQQRINQIQYWLTIHETVALRNTINNNRKNSDADPKQKNIQMQMQMKQEHADMHQNEHEHQYQHQRQSTSEIGKNTHLIIIFNSLAICQQIYNHIPTIAFYLNSTTVISVSEIGAAQTKTLLGKSMLSNNDHQHNDKVKQQWFEIPHCWRCLDILQNQVTGNYKLKGSHQQQQQCPVCLVCYTRSKQSLTCSQCSQQQDNWICMVCGVIGCGRYKNADAFKHYSNSHHILSLDLQTNRIWNYRLDCFSHRIVGLSSGERHGIMDIGQNNQITKIINDIDQENIQMEFWKYCKIVSDQLDRQRDFYNKIKQEQIQRYSAEERILQQKLALLEKQKEEKRELLKKKLKKNKKTQKRNSQLQQTCQEQRQLNKHLEDSIKSQNKAQSTSEALLKKRQQLIRLQQEIEQILSKLT